MNSIFEIYELNQVLIEQITCYKNSVILVGLLMLLMDINTAVAPKIRTHLSVVIGVISFKLGY